MAGKVLFAGFGDIATRAAAELAGSGYELYGLRRHGGWHVAEVTPLLADLTRPSTLAVLRGLNFACVVVSLVPSGRDEDAYRQVYIDGLRNLLAALAQQAAPPPVIFASSTSVYPQQDGCWVDESMAAPGPGFAGRVMLEAEALLVDWPAATLALRFGGIYGPGRDYLLRQVRSGAWAPARPVVYTNRVHSQDCARAIAWFVRASADLRGHSAVNVVDSCPAPLGEVVDWLRSRLGLPAPAPDAPLLQRRGGSKRVSNARLLQTGFRLRYPDFRVGYQDLIG